MKYIKNNRAGFTVIDVLAALVIVAVIGATGWFVYKRTYWQKSTQPTTADFQNSAANAAAVKQGKAVVPTRKYIGIGKTNVIFKAPAGWSTEVVNDPSGSPFYGKVVFKSQDYKEGNPETAGAECGPHQGGMAISLSATYPADNGKLNIKNEDYVDEQVNSKSGLTSGQHKVIMVGQPAVQLFQSSGSCGWMLNTETVKNDFLITVSTRADTALNGPGLNTKNQKFYDEFLSTLEFE